MMTRCAVTQRMTAYIVGVVGLPVPVRYGGPISSTTPCHRFRTARATHTAVGGAAARSGPSGSVFLVEVGALEDHPARERLAVLPELDLEV